MKTKKGRLGLLTAGSAALASLVGGFSPSEAQAQPFGVFPFVRTMASPHSRPHRPFPARPAPFWGEGASYISLAQDEDDLFWGLDVRGNDIYVSGERGPAQGGDKMMFVAKFTTNGRNTLALDASFGTGGVVSLDFSAYQGTADDPNTTANETDNAVESSRGVRVQADGRIVVVGMAEDPDVPLPDRTTPTVLVVARLNADGSVDGSFGDGGVTVLDVGGAAISGGEGGAGDEAPWGLELDAQGRPLISLSASAEASTGRTDRDRYAIRLTVDGQVDTTYAAGTGVVSFDVFQANNDNQRHGLALPGGGLLSTGYTNLAGRNQIYLAQLTPEGTFDTTFSGDGRLRITPFPLGFAECYDAARLRDGSFITTGYGNLYAGEAPPTGVAVRGTDAVQFRITADGSFDSDFGQHGALAYNVNNSNDRGRTLLNLRDDTLVIAGTAIPAGPPAPGQPLNPEDAMIFLANPDGQVRTDFASGVHRLFDFGGADEEFFNIALAPSGQFIVASGYSRLGTQTNAEALLVVLPVPHRHRR